MYAAPGQALPVRVPFLLGGRPVFPDPGPVLYTVYGDGGSPVAGQTNVSVTPPAGADALVVTVPAPVNTTAARIALRRVEVTFAAAGVPATSSVSYKLVALPALWIAPADVRALLGVDEDEVADDDVDLWEAYLEVEQTLGAATLAAAIAAGDRTTVLANRAVAYRAALALTPSLPLRVAQRRQNGVEGFQRAALDVDALRPLLVEGYESCLIDLGGVTDAASAPVFFILTAPPDPVTGG